MGSNRAKKLCIVLHWAILTAFWAAPGQGQTDSKIKFTCPKEYTQGQTYSLDCSVNFDYISKQKCTKIQVLANTFNFTPPVESAFPDPSHTAGDDGMVGYMFNVTVGKEWVDGKDGLALGCFGDCLAEPIATFFAKGDQTADMSEAICDSLQVKAKEMNDMDSGGIGAGAIIGIALGAAVLVIFVCFIILVIIRRQRQEEMEKRKREEEAKKPKRFSVLNLIGAGKKDEPPPPARKKSFVESMVETASEVSSVVSGASSSAKSSAAQSSTASSAASSSAAGD